MKRTDTHRPSAISPDEYQFAAFDHVKIEDIGSGLYAREQRLILAAHMKSTGGPRSGHEHGGKRPVAA